MNVGAYDTLPSTAEDETETPYCTCAVALLSISVLALLVERPAHPCTPGLAVREALCAATRTSSDGDAKVPPLLADLHKNMKAKHRTRTTVTLVEYV